MKTIKAIAAAVAIMFAANVGANDKLVETPLTDENAECFMLRIPVAKAASLFYKKANADKKEWRSFMWNIAGNVAKTQDPRGYMGLAAAYYVSVYANEANNAKELTAKFFNECAEDPENVLYHGHDVAGKMILTATEEMMYNSDDE